MSLNETNLTILKTAHRTVWWKEKRKTRRFL